MINGIDISGPAFIKTSYQTIFRALPPELDISLKEQYLKLENYYSITCEIFDVLQTSSNIFAPYLLELLKRPDFFEFNGIIDISSLKKMICTKFANKYVIFVNCASLAKSLLEFLHMNLGNLNNIIENGKKLKKQFETSTKNELRPVARFMRINIDPILSSLLLKTQKNSQAKLSEKQNTFEVMKYKSHLCFSCKIRPAVFYMEPCMHSAFCHSCMEELNKTDSVFEHCYYCQERVEKLIHLRYLNSNNSLM